MAKTDRVLELLEALQDRPSASGPGAGRAARRRHADGAPRRRVAARARDPGRGRARPGRRLPAATRLPDAAAALHHRRGDRRRARPARRAARRARRRRRAGQAPPRAAGPGAAAGRGARADAPGHRPPRSAAPPSGEHLLLLAEAVVRGRRVHARYTSSEGVESERELSPYGLVAHAGRWYVPAHDHGRGEPRALRADRFGTVQPRRPGEPARRQTSTPSPSSAATLARVPWTHEVEVVLELPLDGRGRPLPARARRARGRRRADRAAHARGVARLGGGAAGERGLRLHRPPAADELRTSLRALATRLTAA